MTTIFGMSTNKRTMFLPEILPADPCAPEHVKHKRSRLRYGLIGRICTIFDARRGAPAVDEVGAHMRRDTGVRDREAFGEKVWDATATWRRPQAPKGFGLEAMQLFSQPRAL